MRCWGVGTAKNLSSSSGEVPISASMMRGSDMALDAWDKQLDLAIIAQQTHTKTLIIIPPLLLSRQRSARHSMRENSCWTHLTGEWPLQSSRRWHSSSDDTIDGDNYMFMFTLTDLTITDGDWRAQPYIHIRAVCVYWNYIWVGSSWSAGYIHPHCWVGEHTILIGRWIPKKLCRWWNCMKQNRFAFTVMNIKEKQQVLTPEEMEPSRCVTFFPEILLKLLAGH